MEKHLLGHQAHTVLARCARLVERFPFLTRDPSLSQDSSEQLPPDVALMRIRHRERQVALEHEGMLAAGVRAVEAGGAKGTDQFPPRNRAERGY